MSTVPAYGDILHYMLQGNKVLVKLFISLDQQNDYLFVGKTLN